MPKWIVEVNDKLTKEFIGSHIKEIREEADKYDHSLFIIFEDDRTLHLSADDESSCVHYEVYQSWSLAKIDLYGTGEERKEAGFA